MNSEASSESPFHLQPDKPGFEALANDNSFRFWWASELAVILGYESLNGFRKAVERAMIALTSLNIPVFDNIVQEQREAGGKLMVDYKLSRFACYLAAMNGDPKKPQVAQAQGYFVAWAEACRLYLEQAEGVERVAIRGEITEHERTLSGTAKMAGVVEYGLFQNAGYRGLYNMDLWRLRRHKGVPPGRSPLDFMGKTELAAEDIKEVHKKLKSSHLENENRLHSGSV